MNDENGGGFHSSFVIFHSPVAAIAVLFLALHLPYLPKSLEDLDSINFALGIHTFDVARHQPHPPGYPLFIVIVKGMRLLVAPDARALALVGVIAGSLGVFAIAALVGRLNGGWLAVALAVATPLYWFTANRPLSDMTGLAAAIAVQAMILSASTSRAFILAAACAGVAVGLRSQVLWLTAPLLIAMGFGIRDWGFVGRRTPESPRTGAPESPRTAAPESLRIPNPESRIPLPFASTLLAYIAGIAAWAVPLVVISGGPRAYWNAVFAQGTEDLSGIRMLWTTPTIPELRDSFYYAFVAPWAVWWLAAGVLALAGIGIAVLSRRDRSALTVIVIAFGPYLLFDVFFQETFTGRYALPLVVPVAYLAARGATALPAYAGVAAAIGAAAFGAHIGGTSVAAYARQPAPAFRLLADMTSAGGRQPAILAADRREALDLRAPVKYLGGAYPNVVRQLSSPPQREWLEPVQYWNAGGRAPVWFLADPARTDVDLIGHAEPKTYRWSLPYPVLMSGVRPNEIDWYVLDPPRWYVGEGWALTPEAAGVARLAGTRHPLHAWIGGRPAQIRAIAIGGRNLSDGPATIQVDGPISARFTVPPGFFARIFDVRHGPDGDGSTDVETREVTVDAQPPSAIAFEQFDAGSSVMAFGPGWHEQEYNPATGLRWRWMSSRGDLLVSSSRSVVLRIDGESPRKYFANASRLVVKGAGRVFAERSVDDDFSLTIPIEDPPSTITIETDQTYVPAERSRRLQDRRHLGLRIVRCELQPASAPGR